MKKKILALLMTLAVAAFAAVGCSSNEASQPAQESAAQTESISPEAEPTEATQADKSAEGEQLLADLKGTYEQLWDVVLADKYSEDWLEAASAIVGEENAQGAVEMLKSSVTGELYGQEAVDAYANSEGGAFNCSFLQGVDQFTFDGNTISGADKDGSEVFSHEYAYISYDEATDFYVYETQDADAGEFKYFALRPDTPAKTYHIEFRYGSDADALVQFDSGAYAYWMASGIPTGDNAELAKQAIKLFCEENLQQAE